MTDVERVKAAKNLAKSAHEGLGRILTLHDQEEKNPRNPEDFHHRIRIMTRLQIIASDLNTAATSIRDLRLHFGSSISEDRT